MLKELTALSAEEERKARHWLKSSGNRAFVLVHPFYAGLHLHGTAISPQKIESLLFPKSGDARTPVFLFEEEHILKEAVEKIRGMEAKHAGEKRRGIIIVPTKIDCPAPAKGDWDSLAEKMKGIGAERLFVCGKFLELFDRKQIAEGAEKDIEYRHSGLHDEHPAYAEALVEDAKIALEQHRKVAALEKEVFGRIFDSHARVKAGKGVSEEELGRQREKYMEKTNFGAAWCVGETYGRLLTSNAFKTVRLMKKYCE
ncbi:MAG: hypothetical protein NTY90_05825 [Candidatus Micrarchaeota archaeon]|nr:hypothetical protein [Candidatus Micrarchaeota archaeon]